VQILLWLAPPAVVTVLAMIWAAWAGRPQREEAQRSEAAYERFAAAIAKEHPAAGRPRPYTVRDRSTGIAVRPSRGGPTRTSTGTGTGARTAATGAGTANPRTTRRSA
jgi:hypothetical protein